MAVTQLNLQGQGNVNALIQIRIESTNSKVTGSAIISSTGETEIVALKGHISNNQENSLLLSIIKYDSSNPNSESPLAGQINLSYDSGSLAGNFTTVIGSSGTLFLEKTPAIKAPLLLIPNLHKTIVVSIKSLKKYFRYIYSLYLITIASFSFYSEHRSLSWVELILLSTPLLFLFRDKIQEMITVMSVQKIGPVEFKEQTHNPAIDIAVSINHLHEAFGKNLPKFSALNRFFVPRTKEILKLIQSNNKRSTSQEIKEFSRNIGIPHQSLSITITVLIENSCLIQIDENTVQITDIGESFLEFEKQMNLLK